MNSALGRFSKHFLALAFIVSLFLSEGSAVAEDAAHFVQKVELRECSTEGADATVVWTSGQVTEFEMSWAVSYAVRSLKLNFQTPNRGVVAYDSRAHDGSRLAFETEFSAKDGRFVGSGMLSMEYGELIDDVLTHASRIVSLARSDAYATSLEYSCAG